MRSSTEVIHRYTDRIVGRRTGGRSWRWVRYWLSKGTLLVSDTQTRNMEHDLTLTRSHKPSVDPYCRDHPQYCIGGALSSDYYTSTGAFNGSGIAIAGESWNNEEKKIMTVYFQHWTGEIRWIQLTPKGEWLGGSRSEVVVTDAKNATPISVVAYAVNGTSQVGIIFLAR